MEQVIGLILAAKHNYEIFHLKLTEFANISLENQNKSIFHAKMTGE
jgi:hypothetical protein